MEMVHVTWINAQQKTWHTVGINRTPDEDGTPRQVLPIAKAVELGRDLIICRDEQDEPPAVWGERTVVAAAIKGWSVLGEVEEKPEAPAPEPELEAEPSPAPAAEEDGA